MLITRDELAELSDTDLAAETQRRNDELMKLPRQHPERDAYILAWRKCIDEMDHRARTDLVRR
jgi:hypothetical protein